MWNWQHPDWPNFTWDPARLRHAEEHFLIGIGRLEGTIRHLLPLDHEQLTVEAISGEALTTSEIEGELLDRASVQSSVRGQLGLNPGHRLIKPAEQGIAEMMVDLHRTFAEPLSAETLFRWHSMLFRGRETADTGRYRTSSEPMQIVSGAISAPKVHFEAPPSSRIRKEMSAFIAWFNRTAPDGSQPIPSLTRAGLSHLYFESLHPFDDGNGRIGRAVSEKALMQSAGHQTLIALAQTILIRRKAYYLELERASRSNEVTAWLAWFAGLTLEAQNRTESRIQFLLDKTRLLDRLKGRLNHRQEKVLLRMLREGPEGFEGGLSAANYLTISGTSPATATRDLNELVTLGALTRTGERRHTRYFLALPLRPVVAITLDRNGTLR